MNYKLKSNDNTRSIKWEYEDQLDFELTDNMFNVSKVFDGVRMYPYIEIGFDRYYLEGEKESLNEYERHFFIPSNTRYMGDLQASEILKNNSVCVLENGKIRNLKNDDKINSVLLVYVYNCHKTGEEVKYIEKNEYVRYTTL